MRFYKESRGAYPWKTSHTYPYVPKMTPLGPRARTDNSMPMDTPACTHRLEQARGHARRPAHLLACHSASHKISVVLISGTIQSPTSRQMIRKTPDRGHPADGVSASHWQDLLRSHSLLLHTVNFVWRHIRNNSKWRQKDLGITIKETVCEWNIASHTVTG